MGFLLPAVGLGVSLLSNFLASKNKKLDTHRFPRFNQAQEGLLNQLTGQIGGLLPGGLSYLGSMLNQSPEALKQFTAPYMREFQEKTIPTIAERFIGSGALGGTEFGHQALHAGTKLQENLAALHGRLGSGALGQLQSLLGASMTPTFETQTSGRRNPWAALGSIAAYPAALELTKPGSNFLSMLGSGMGG